MKSELQAIYKETIQQLTQLYEENEAESIAGILFQDLLNLSRTYRLTHASEILPDNKVLLWAQGLKRLMNHEPIQHVAGFCHFYHRKFEVSRETLIPRPETEELVELIIRENRSHTLKLLDVGTGTGCIAISLAAELTDALVTAWDISENALEVAKTNANAHQVQVEFQGVDVLKYRGDALYDIIVSNPPYIPEEEKKKMDKNVLNFEPDIALFVPDEDPLLFYRKIGRLGKKNLTTGGRLYFEINENFGQQVEALLGEQGYFNVIVLKDLQGKDRIVKATNP